MSLTLAFDVYGTLIDTHGVVVKLKSLVGDKAVSFSQSWRDKQLEYSFRRGLMGDYQHFGVCTRDALEYTCRVYQIDLSDQDKDSLLACYRSLPVFADVVSSINALKAEGHALYAFSNGHPEAVSGLLGHAGIEQLFIDIISVDELETFKPAPAVYQLFLERTQSDPEETWLISSNPFDVIGAVNVGMKAAWVQRSPEAVFDPWGVEPDLVVSELTDLSGRLPAPR